MESGGGRSGGILAGTDTYIRSGTFWNCGGDGRDRMCSFLLPRAPPYFCVLWEPVSVAARCLTGRTHIILAPWICFYVFLWAVFSPAALIRHGDEIRAEIGEVLGEVVKGKTWQVAMGSSGSRSGVLFQSPLVVSEARVTCLLFFPLPPLSLFLD